jgi:hypothetical protein
VNREYLQAELRKPLCTWDAGKFNAVELDEDRANLQASGP